MLLFINIVVGQKEGSPRKTIRERVISLRKDSASFSWLVLPSSTAAASATWVE